MQGPKYVSNILSKDVGFRQLISVATQKLNEALCSKPKRERNLGPVPSLFSYVQINSRIQAMAVVEITTVISWLNKECNLTGGQQSFERTFYPRLPSTYQHYVVS